RRKPVRRDGGAGLTAPRRVDRSSGEPPAADPRSAALARALADGDPAVRALAVETISAFSADEASRLLSRLLHDPDPSVRVAAIDSAARAGATGVVFAIILALEDVDAEVRTRAAVAIETLTGKPVDIDDGDAEVRREQVTELKKWWKEQRLA